MPTYEYRCPHGHEFELFQRMSDEPVAPCPECGESSERQLSGGAGFLFKGSGFYITDYRSPEYKEKASKESGGASSNETAASEPAKPSTSETSASSSPNVDPAD